jgi:Zn-dependent M28 family amino/carboxypeptidase
LGIVEGTDPQLKDEFIVVCAHLDHLGTFERYVYNGANDNGSGAAALLEIAEAFSANPLKPKRSILFAFWTGEELGFLGSSYYTLHPAYPLEKTKAVLNMDMIGLKWTAEAIKLSQNWLKYDDYDSFSAQLKGKPFLSPIIGTSCTDLNNALKDNNQYVDFAMYIRKTHEAGGSDQYPFSLKNINWMVIYGCMPEFYHQPADHLEKVDLPYVEKIARLVYLTAFQLANQ